MMNRPLITKKTLLSLLLVSLFAVSLGWGASYFSTSKDRGIYPAVFSRFGELQERDVKIQFGEEPEFVALADTGSHIEAQFMTSEMEAVFLEDFASGDIVSVIGWEHVIVRDGEPAFGSHGNLTLKDVCVSYRSQIQIRGFYTRSGRLCTMYTD